MSNTLQFEVLVVGAGPAGIAAAVSAAAHTNSVAIVDDNPAIGGQIWRAALEKTNDGLSEKWRGSLGTAGITKLCGTRVFHQPVPGILLAESGADICELRYQNLILATGARERFLPFPGWTLPNVMGAGGLQALVKSGLPIEKKRVVVAGSGPLLLAVAAYLRQHGAEIPVICEQASWISLARLGATLLGYPQKIRQGLTLKRELAGVPFATNSWPLEANGSEFLQQVTISQNGTRKTLDCDYLACGFHLVPNTELPQLLGCRLVDGRVDVDDFQRTNVTQVFCAGEPTGIGGLESALVQGQIAGLATVGRTDEARKLFPERAKMRRFARALDRAFRLRTELRELVSPTTIICRCEDVTHARLAHYNSWRAAKLQTRCGMGSCQGRVCGPAAEFLFGWRVDSVRPPVFPVRIESLAFPTGQSTEVAGGQR